MKPFVSILLSSLALIGCRRQFNDGSQIKFVAVQTLSGEVASPVRLAKADELRIPYQAVTLVGEFSSNPAIPEYNRNFLRFRFGKLSKAQFDSLMNAYSLGRSRVVYSPKRDNYELIDFLPIPVQALDSMRLATHADVGGSFAAKDEKLAILANCWMTAYEFLSRNETEFRTWKANVVGEQVFEVLMDAKYSNPVPLSEDETKQEKLYLQAFMKNAVPEIAKTTTPNGNNMQALSDLMKRLAETGKLPAFPAYGQLNNLKPGDLLLVGSKDNPLHAAIYLDKDLFFERTQVGERVGGGFRLVSWNDILAAYLPFPGQFSYWRVHGVLPPPEQFTLPAGDSDAEMPVRHHKYSFEENGRAFFNLNE